MPDLWEQSLGFAEKYVPMQQLWLRAGDIAAVRDKVVYPRIQELLFLARGVKGSFPILLCVPVREGLPAQLHLVVFRPSLSRRWRKIQRSRMVTP